MIKNTALLICMCLIANVSFGESILNIDQERTVLQEIDNICGDTWCEGDFDYEFNSFKCFADKKICIMNFKMKQDKMIFTESCIVKNKVSFEQIMPDKALGTDIYSNLTDCINEIEYNLHKILLDLNKVSHGR